MNVIFYLWKALLVTQEMLFENKNYVNNDYFVWNLLIEEEHSNRYVLPLCQEEWRWKNTNV